MSFARFIQSILALPGGAGLGEVWAGKAGAVQRELSWFVGPALCLHSESALQLSGSGTRTGTSSEQSYRNKTRQQVLGNLLWKCRALLGLGAAQSWQSQPHISEVEELGGDVATEGRGGPACVWALPPQPKGNRGCSAHPCFGCRSRTHGACFNGPYVPRNSGSCRSLPTQGDGINGTARTSVTDTDSSGVAVASLCLSYPVIKCFLVGFPVAWPRCC